MPELLYLGNQLSKYGLNPTSVDFLGDRLSKEFNCIRGSDKKNPVLRLLHMWYLIIRNRRASYLLIDTYSTNAFWYAITASWLAWLLKLDYIPILHGGDLPQRKKTSSGVLRNFLKNAAYVVCPSGYLKAEMEDFYNREYELIPNSIDLGNYPFCQKHISDGIRLIWVRSFHEIYNPLLAIDVLELLTEKGLNAQLVMVGPNRDGSLERTKAYAKEKGVLNNVLFTGGLPKKEWIEISKDCNLFFNTTNVDNTPVSVMEAMALGFPVISTNVGGLPYLIDSRIDGVLVGPKNASGFVTEILRLKNDPDSFMEISQNARKKAETWDWKHIREKWIQLLR